MMTIHYVLENFIEIMSS